MPGNYIARPAVPSHQPSMPAQPMYPARPPAGVAGAYTAHVTHGNAILVNSNQRGNPVLKYLRNVNHRFADIVPDFQFNDKVLPPTTFTRQMTTTPALNAARSFKHRKHTSVACVLP